MNYNFIYVYLLHYVHRHVGDRNAIKVHLEIIVHLLVFNTFYTAIPLHPSHPPSVCQPGSHREKVILLQLYESFTSLI